MGRHVVAALTSAGHEPVVLSRSHGVDVTTGEGLDAALDGVQAAVDVTNVVTVRRRTSVAFFVAATANLLAAGRRAGVAHHVALSIVGIDRVDYGYYEGKRQQERLALAGDVPATVLRATQFHDFPAQVTAHGVGPLRAVPRMRVQPVASSEVGEALARLAVGPAVGRAPDIAGPEVHELVELARRLVRAQGKRLRVVPFRMPGAAGRAMAEGGLLPGGGATLGRITFDDWLGGHS